MKRYLLLLGMSLCLGITYAQGYQTPQAVAENPILKAQISKVGQAKTVLAQSSRSGSNVAQQELQTQLEIYLRLLQEQMDLAMSEEMKNVLRSELDRVHQQLNLGQTKH
jgi:hypothetical protein